MTRYDQQIPRQRHLIMRITLSFMKQVNDLGKLIIEVRAGWISWRTFLFSVLSHQHLVFCLIFYRQLNREIQQIGFGKLANILALYWHESLP
ncbi:hypothetical protein [Pedobacter chinensis]|uniref:hypothetical protein n=1 Tax=Pedobacter chinensis TaxID=2282421 RepID=UPI0011C0408C|nr:hypothetical protein [Pedobacter chinensis]